MLIFLRTVFPYSDSYLYTWELYSNKFKSFLWVFHFGDVFIFAPRIKIVLLIYFDTGYG